MTHIPSPADMAGRPRRPLTARPLNPNAYRPLPPAAGAAGARTPSSGTSFGLRFTAGVLADPGLHRTAKRLALLLADRADAHGVIRDDDQMGIRSLAELVGCGATAAREHMNRLDRRGWIRRDRAPEGRPTRISLRIPDRPPH